MFVHQLSVTESVALDDKTDFELVQCSRDFFSLIDYGKPALTQRMNYPVTYTFNDKKKNNNI